MLVAGLLLSAALPVGARASGTDLTALRSRLAADMAAAGRYSGAYVYDVSTHRVLFASRADVQRPPASVEKLFTSTSALTHFGPSAVLSTTVLSTGRLDAAGVWHGDLYLHGGGDPTFGDAGFVRNYYGAGRGATVSELAAHLQERGIVRIEGRVLGDESLFDSRRGGPNTDYGPDPEVEGTLSALSFDRGQSGGEAGQHAPAAYAALMLAAALRARGIRVTGGSGTGVAPGGAAELAAIGSPPLRTLLRLMDAPSDNYLAEMLVKDLGAYYAGAGTTAAGAGVVGATLGSLGVNAHVVDGSGLSRSDRTSPHAVAVLLSKLSSGRLGPVLRAALARPGRPGTLRYRLRYGRAYDHCQGKTGTLAEVSNLAGWCTAAGGDTLVFALFMDALSEQRAHALQDAMTTDIASYAQPPPS